MARILIVDSDPVLLQWLKRQLEAEGHAVEGASDGAAALALAQTTRFEVAIVDHTMSSSLGLRLLSQLCALQPDCIRVLSAERLSLPMLVSALNEWHINHVLAKPIRADQLQQTIALVIQTRQHMQQVWRDEARRMRDEECAMVQACIEGGHISLAFQPIFTATERTLVAHECLLRSTHPHLHGPMEVIGVAERCGMLHDITAEVARQAADWMPRLPDGTALFMNFHPDEMLEPARLLEGLTPLLPWAERVVLELTEHTQLQGEHDSESVIRSLRARGFRLALDDLGAGYSSLTVLASHQPDYVKLDMALVRDIHTDPYRTRLIRILVQIAESTDAVLLAEGVETEAEMVTLLDCGVHQLQGYLLGRPLPGTERFGQEQTIAV